MKWLLLLCAFLVQLFGAMPCSDEQAPKSHYSISSSCEDHHAPGADHCSPFCSCSCCGSSIVQVGALMPPSFSGRHQRNYPFPAHSALCRIDLPVWEPPKLF